ncbi:hypothetical protein [Kosakonia radicincitans]|uniref:hypothetical protein n=1 Tax=Kosakonia radicincitans TaxID=283686 RepID=UPI0022B5897B|nr:hypothetical protein [Kosakonia radicincitans]
MKLRGDKIISYTSNVNTLISEPEKPKKDHIADAYSDAKFLDWQNPAWSEGGPVHNWHNHASSALKLVWNTFTDDQKRIIAAMLDNEASNEHWD